MIYLQIAILIYILAMFVLLLMNYRGYKELAPTSKLPERPPRVSIIVPQPDCPEALRACLSALSRQRYPDMEILILDDGKNPNIKSVIDEVGRDYDHIKHIVYSQTPADWSDKTFAQHQGALAARGEWLLFTDTDVILQPDCLARCVAHCLEKKVDLFSLMPGQELRSVAEKLLLPIVFGWFGTRFSIEKVNDPESTQAVGVRSFMLIRATVYQTSGGFQTVRNEILEDSALAREIKNLGLSYQLIGGRELLTSRIYGGLPAVWTRCMRIFVGEVGSSVPAIIGTVTVIGLTSIAPFVSVLWCAAVGFDRVDPWVLALSVFQCMVVLSARLVLDYILKIGPWFAFLHPIGAIGALSILISSFFHLAQGSLETSTGRVSAELQEDA